MIKLEEILQIILKKVFEILNALSFEFNVYCKVNCVVTFEMFRMI